MTDLVRWRGVTRQWYQSLGPLITSVPRSLLCDAFVESLLSPQCGLRTLTLHNPLSISANLLRKLTTLHALGIDGDAKLTHYHISPLINLRELRVFPPTGKTYDDDPSPPLLIDAALSVLPQLVILNTAGNPRFFPSQLPYLANLTHLCVDSWDYPDLSKLTNLTFLCVAGRLVLNDLDLVTLEDLRVSQLRLFATSHDGTEALPPFPHLRIIEFDQLHTHGDPLPLVLPKLWRLPRLDTIRTDRKSVFDKLVDSLRNTQQSEIWQDVSDSSMFILSKSTAHDG